MRIQALLLTLALLTPTLSGCPPVRQSDDDDSAAGDDDDSTEGGYALEEGRWASSPVLATSDECGVANEDVVLSLEISESDDWSFRADFDVDAPQECSIDIDGRFSCPTAEFVVEDDPDATLRGSIDFDGSILSETSLEAVVEWVITCTGDCDGYDLPNGVTCSITMEATFEPLNEPDPEPPIDG